MRRSNLRWLVVSLVAAVLAFGCATRVDVTTIVKSDVDFEAFDTFAITPPVHVADEAIRKRLELEVAEEFESRGYRAAPQTEADLWVAFQGTTVQAERRVFGESPGGCCVVEDYVAGTLVVDVLSSHDRSRLWRGVGRVDLQNEDDIEKVASDAVAAVLEKFPRQVVDPE